jgi:glucosamine-6-phosphate deaminase
MKILILPDKIAAVSSAARTLADKVRDQPTAILGLATGETMIPLYRAILEISVTEFLSFSKISTFNLDEYVGLPFDHSASFRTYMQNWLFQHADFNPELTHFLDGDAKDLILETSRYEKLIADVGGIDLQLLGIGENGHIGFNEPSSSLASRTRIKTLTKTTLEANKIHFKDIKKMPLYSLTMGVGTILDSRQCVLLATGSKKASAVAQMIEGPVTATCPASALQFHPNTLVILDDQAARDLKMRDYYEYVHPGINNVT